MQLLGDYQCIEDQSHIQLVLLQSLCLFFILHCVMPVLRQRPS
jgi:hypothetical protein